MSKEMKIGITGTIGSGKSEVANYLRSKGYYVFDCDEYNNTLLNNKEVLSAIKKTFKDAFVNNELDKKKLASIIFNNSSLKKQLEDILHPLIIEELKRQSILHSLFFAEVPLLFETNLEDLFDKTLLIVSDDKIAIKRLINKGYSEKDAISRINNQLDVNNKMLRADEIIYNNNTLQDLHLKVDEWLKKYVR